MNLGLIISVVAIFASLYWLALVGYRLLLSLKGLKAAGTPLQISLEKLKDPVEIEFQPATNHTADDLAQVLAKREQLKKAKREVAESRRRRLIERLDEIDLDKR